LNFFEGKEDMNTNVQKVIEIAKDWDKKSIYGTPGCPNETSAFFVRHVFKTALHQAGIMAVAHFRPYYLEQGIKSLPTGKSLADGLAGDQIGPKVPEHTIQAGDLLFFKDTYKSQELPEGSITHVGIALNASGLMADSSRGRCQVRNYRIAFPQKLVEVRRPICLKKLPPGIGVTLTKGQVLRAGKFQQLKVKFGVSERERIYGGMRGLGFKPKVNTDGLNIRYSYITVDITAASGKNIKMFHHDGRTSAFVSGRKATNLEIIAKWRAGLQLWIDGKEVKPSAVTIGIS
jgi:hypothetical protein